MKTYKLLIGLLSLVSFFSCTGDDIKEMEGSATRVNEIDQITATVADYGTTRSELYREDNAIKFRWSVGDKMGIFPDTGDQVCFTIDDSQAGSLSARFDGGGWGLKQSHTYRVYFPYIRDIDLTKESIPLDYTGQQQTGIDTYTHLGQYDFLASDAVTPTDSYLNFTMDHLGSIMLLKLKAAEAGTYTSMTITAVNDVFTTKAELNIAGETPVVTAKEKSKSMTLQLQDVTISAVNEEFTLSMMTLPVDLSAETLKVLLTRDDGKVFSGIIEEPKNIEQGKPFEMTAELKDWIVFADAKVKAICVQHWDTDGDGELSYKEAAAVTQIYDYFHKSDITSFDEFQYFVNVEYLGDSFLGDGWIDEEISDMDVTFRYGAFEECVNLRSITLPEGLKTIGYGSFAGCAFSSIIIPESVNIIRERAFGGCKNLSSINIPNSIDRITGFNGCSNLTSFTIPNTVKSIGTSAFSYCTGLTSITIPDGVTGIGDNAFEGCTGLTSITIPDGITGIGDFAFAGCNNIDNIVLPSGVTSIGYSAFACNLESLTIFANSVPFFYGHPDWNGEEGAPIDPFGPYYKYPIYVPSSSVNAYKEALPEDANRIRAIE